MAITGRNQDQFSKSMRVEMQRWLIDEGVTKKLMDNMIDFSKVHEVMSF